MSTIWGRGLRYQLNNVDHFQENARKEEEKLRASIRAQFATHSKGRKDRDRMYRPDEDGRFFVSWDYWKLFFSCGLLIFKLELCGLLVSKLPCNLVAVLSV